MKITLINREDLNIALKRLQDKGIRLFLPSSSENLLAYKIEYKSSVKKDLKRISKDEVNKILDQIEIVLTDKLINFLY